MIILWSYYISFEILVRVEVLGKHLGVRVWAWVAHLVIVEWELFALTCLVKIGEILDLVGQGSGCRFCVTEPL